MLFPKVTICPILWSRYNLTEVTTGSEQKESIPTPLSISSCRSFPNGPDNPSQDCFGIKTRRGVKYDIEGLTNDPIFSCFDLNLNKEAFANQYQNEAFMHIKIKSLNRYVDNSSNAVAVYFTDTNRSYQLFYLQNR